MLTNTLVEFDEYKSWWCTIESIRYSLGNAVDNNVTQLDLERLSTLSYLLRRLSGLPKADIPLNEFELVNDDLLSPPISTSKIKKEIEQTIDLRKFTDNGNLNSTIEQLCVALDKYVEQNGKNSMGMKEISALRNIIDKLSDTAQALLYEPKD